MIRRIVGAVRRRLVLLAAEYLAGEVDELADRMRTGAERADQAGGGLESITMGAAPLEVDSLAADSLAAALCIEVELRDRLDTVIASLADALDIAAASGGYLKPPDMLRMRAARRALDQEIARRRSRHANGKAAANVR